MAMAVVVFFTALLLPDDDDDDDDDESDPTVMVSCLSFCSIAWFQPFQPFHQVVSCDGWMNECMYVESCVSSLSLSNTFTVF